jgi:hypothetical protein
LPDIAPIQWSEPATPGNTGTVLKKVLLPTIAMPSFLIDHNELLEASSQLEARAKKLEEEQTRSNYKIIGLTEETLFLRAQIMELKRDLENLSRHRYECRQTAMQEVIQYVKIINNASRLEEMRTDVARANNAIREESEKNVVALSAVIRENSGGTKAGTGEDCREKHCGQREYSDDEERR